MLHSPITLEALAVIDAIDKRGSYASAAEQLNKVPSALSYIVQKLEEQLAVTLFQKQGRRSVLTPAGRHLLVEGRHVLQAVNVLSDKTKAIATGWESRLRIAIDSAMDPVPIFAVLETFLKDHPLIEIDISEEVLNGAWEALIEDQVDLLIGAPPPMPTQKGIDTVALGAFDPVFVVTPDHPLSHLPTPLTEEDIAQYRTIVVHDSAQAAIPWTRGVISKSRYFYVPTLEYKIKAQLSGLGVGFLPRSRAQPHLDSGEFIEIPVADEHMEEHLLMAWKIVNRGKGLQQLKSMLLDAELLPS
ncbi:LysR family transcriptional regulator [Gammaproteobacteria bacterium 45_16_T64]|nr:LysR family transcriptional regulator [Gammaproteobacteria bacterium 45_16_T64]